MLPKLKKIAAQRSKKDAEADNLVKKAKAAYDKAFKADRES